MKWVTDVYWGYDQQPVNVRTAGRERANISLTHNHPPTHTQKHKHKYYQLRYSHIYKTWFKVQVWSVSYSIHVFDSVCVCLH